MKKALSLLFAIGITFGCTLSLFAQTPGSGNRTPVVRKRQHNQQQRIRQGVRSGELTRRETRTLEHQQREIQQDKKEAKADGTVTKEERIDLQKEQNQASRSIYRKKHNRRDRN